MEGRVFSQALKLNFGRQKNLLIFNVIKEYRFWYLYIFIGAKIIIHSMQLTNTYYPTLNLNINLGEGRDMDIESGA